MTADEIAARAKAILDHDLRQVQAETSRIFLWLFLVQWLIAILLSVTISPYAWAGRAHSIHFHVGLAIIGGAVLNAFPIALLILRPRWVGTRHVVAITQMLWSAVFIHLTGGRIETHFHIFGSLAFLSFYRDPRLLITATFVVAIHHLLLGFFDPQSVYGIANPAWWRFLDHAGWVIFEDIVLFLGCQRALREMATLSDREATLDLAKQDVEQQVEQRTEELKASGERYRALIENTNAAPWELEYESCRIIYVAPQMTEIFGLALNSTSGHNNFLELLHPDDRLLFKHFVKKTAEGEAGGQDYIDSRIVSADNRQMHVRSFVAARKAGSGNTFGISLNVTQQKKMELELLQAQKLESIGQLSAGIAHEINTPTQFIGDNVRFLQESVGEMLSVVERLTPLVAVEGAPAGALVEIAALLRMADIDYFKEEVPKAISQSLEGVERISKIVGAMKEFSHPAADKAPHDLNRAITSTITVASNEWRYVAEVKTDFDANLPFVPVMPGPFNQVILNILVNAAHAVGEAVADAPGTKGVIAVSTRKLSDWAEIRIQDSGCGMPEEIRHRIFDPFFTTKEVGKGTGQGLAIAQDVIVKKHHGTIAVESAPGLGTTFVLRLPLESSATDATAAAA
jgi:PAS domain S-box-containing protein